MERMISRHRSCVSPSLGVRFALQSPRARELLRKPSPATVDAEVFGGTMFCVGRTKGVYVDEIVE